MRFLTPTGGDSPDEMGILVSPGTKGIPSAIKAGRLWAADNQAFTKGYNPDVFLPWLDSMKPYQSTCLFVVCPDVVGDALATIERFNDIAPALTPWPLALAAQDGQEDLPFPDPDLWACLFIGGSTEWKESQAAIDCIRRAQAIGKHIHIGRINWKRRYNLFRILEGSESFTCDGTRTRFEGVDKTHAAWMGYMSQPPLIQI